MYINLKLGKFKLSFANKDEYLIPQTQEFLKCKKGFRMQYASKVVKFFTDRDNDAQKISK